MLVQPFLSYMYSVLQLQPWILDVETKVLKIFNNRKIIFLVTSFCLLQVVCGPMLNLFVLHWVIHDITGGLSSVLITNSESCKY